MCTKPHPVAKKAYEMFFDSNLGDPGLFPGSKKVEKEVIAKLSDLLHGVESCGMLVTGGTEANLSALYAAKKQTMAPHPEVILSDSAHFSLQKVCNILSIKAVYAPIDTTFRVDPDQVEKLINKNTIAIVSTAGTSELGVIDPIDQLSHVALKYGVWLHVDAAFGGLVIPFLKSASYAFDFSVPGVSSITVDPHKMGMAAIPTGSILYREKSMLRLVETETPYLTENAQYTFAGTRTGASAASAWAVFQVLGMEGFQKVVGGCMRNTSRLIKGLKKAGCELFVQPTLNIVAFRSLNTKLLAKKMKDLGWFVSYVPRYDCIRVIIMPHIKARHITNFLNDLEVAENAIKQILNFSPISK
jgi:tyrosine decarboxylase / aspartate 1-decarboxylase